MKLLKYAFERISQATRKQILKPVSLNFIYPLKCILDTVIADRWS